MVPGVRLPVRQCDLAWRDHLRHHGGDDLTPFVRRRTDDCHIGDGLFLHEDVLDLSWIHVESAADDEVLCSSYNPEVPICVQLS